MKTAYFALVVAIIVIACKGHETNRIKFTNLICDFNPEYYTKEYICRIRFNEKRRNTLNFKGTIKRAIRDGLLTVDIYERKSKYIPTFANITIDICQFFNNKVKNPLGKIFSDYYAKFSRYNASCPLIGPFELMNFDPDLSQIPSVIPKSDLLVLLTFWNKATTEVYSKIKIFLTVTNE